VKGEITMYNKRLIEMLIKGYFKKSEIHSKLGKIFGLSDSQVAENIRKSHEYVGLKYCIVGNNITIYVDSKKLTEDEKSEVVVFLKYALDLI
jgi:hypothetical protein